MNNQKQIPLRLTPELYDQVKILIEQAEARHRRTSLNTIVTVLLMRLVEASNGRGKKNTFIGVINEYL